MPRPATDDRVIIRFDLKEAIDLEELSQGFSALARQYRKAIERRGFSEDQVPAKLLVTRLSTGSFEAEIAAYSMIAVSLIKVMDATLIFTDFTTRIRLALEFFARGRKRPNDLSREDVSDLETFIKPIAGRRGAKLGVKVATYHEKTERREIHASYEFNEKELSTAFVNIARELEQDSDTRRPTHKVQKNVMLRWAQTNWVEAKSKGRTGDRAVIETISDRPLPVYFPTETSTIKYKMTSEDFNPSKRAYIVDVDVQTIDTEPVAYTVMELHRVVDLGGDQ